MINKLVQKLYDEVAPTVKTEHTWLFIIPVEDRLSEGYSIKVAWTDVLKKIYLDEYWYVVDELRCSSLEPMKVE